MAQRRWLRALGPALLLSVGGAYALASYNWCGRWPESAPQLVASQHGEGSLRAGAAKVAIQPPYPVVRAGYGPMRPEVSSTELPLHARALVFEQGEVRVGIVSVELLLVPGRLTEAVVAETRALGIDELWVAATHAHSSLGGFDDRLLSQIAGTGRFQEASRRAVVTAAAAALKEAVAQLQPASLERADGSAGARVLSRAAGMAPDDRITRMRILGGAATIAEWVVLSAHATMEPRQGDQLSPDYPGWLSAESEKDGGITLVTMGAVGNSSTAGSNQPELYGAELSALVRKLPVTSQAEQLAFARAQVALPRPDASRLVPRIVRRAGENFLCTSASRTAEVSVLQLGTTRYVAVPGELTTAAAPSIEAPAGGRAVSLVNDYVGYVEAPGIVGEGGGESHRQYFGAALAERLAEAAKLAASALDAR